MGKEKFAAVNTKLRVLQSRLLTNDDFEHLLHSSNIPAIAAYLKNDTHYNAILGDIHENDIHRGQLERLIKMNRTDEIRKIGFYLPVEYKKFFNFVHIKLEVEDLKKILINIRNKNVDTEKNAMTNTGIYVKTVQDDLLKAKTEKEFIKALRNTVYYKYLRPFEETDFSDSKYSFMGEMALDLAYFEILYNGVKKLDKKDNLLIHKIYGTNADLLNIMWIYRGLKYYQFPREVLFNYTIPAGYRLEMKEIKNFCYTNDPEDIKNALVKHQYGFLLAEDDIYMERRCLKHMYKMVRRLEAFHLMDLSEAVAFDFLLDYEIRDIITVIEGIRYGSDSNETKSFLIREL